MATAFVESGTDATQDFAFYLSTATGGTGTITSDTGQSNTGPRSIKCTQGVGAGSAVANTPYGVVTDTGSQYSYWLRFDTLPGAASQHSTVDNSSGSGVLQIRMNTTGTMRIAPVGATAVDGTYPCVINTWYRVVVSYYITNTTTYQIKLYLHAANNALLDTLTANAGTLTRTGSSRIRFGAATGNWGNNTNIWIDDIYVATGGASSSSQPDIFPNIKIVHKRPFSNGTTNDFDTQIGSGNSGYGSGHADEVNEQPRSDSNGWAKVGAGAVVTEEYTIESAVAGDASVVGLPIVDLVGWVRAGSALSETGQIVVAGATSNISLTSTITMFTKASDTHDYPAGGTDIGIVTDTTLTTVSLYECGIHLAMDYGAVPGKYVAIPF